jgi:hypothetical protein
MDVFCYSGVVLHYLHHECPVCRVQERCAGDGIMLKLSGRVRGWVALLQMLLPLPAAWSERAGTDWHSISHRHSHFHGCMSSLSHCCCWDVKLMNLSLFELADKIAVKREIGHVVQ